MMYLFVHDLSFGSEDKLKKMLFIELFENLGQGHQNLVIS